MLLRHVLPNAVRPLVTLLGLSLPALIAGSVVVESVFSFPGLGWLLWRSALAHDYPVLIGIVCAGWRGDDRRQFHGRTAQHLA